MIKIVREKCKNRTRLGFERLRSAIFAALKNSVVFFVGEAIKKRML
jgi:hypothetical protein